MLLGSAGSTRTVLGFPKIGHHCSSKDLLKSSQDAVLVGEDDKLPTWRLLSPMLQTILDPETSFRHSLDIFTVLLPVKPSLQLL